MKCRGDGPTVPGHDVSLQYCQDLAWNGLGGTAAFQVLSQSEKNRIADAVNRELSGVNAKGLFILLPVCVVTMLVGFTGTAHKQPPCQCEVTVYKKKRKGVLPCIVGILRDSPTQKPLILDPIVINNTVSWANDQGRTYTDVLSGKRYTLVAKCFTYYFCTQKIVAQERDSIVCIFNMRRNREPSDNAADFMHRSFFQRVRALFKR